MGVLEYFTAGKVDEVSLTAGAATLDPAARSYPPDAGTQAPAEL